MTPAEAASLLTIASAYDNRKPDADTARAWAMALDGIRFEDARDAVVGHYRVSREWLMPSDVISGVKVIRADRIAKFGPIEPPGQSSEDYRAWFIDTRTRIGDGELTRAQYDAENPLPPARKMPELDGVFRSVPNVPADHRPTKPKPAPKEMSA